MTRIQMLALIAAAFALTAISEEPVWAQSRTEVIAQTGQAAPDGNGTFLYFLSSPVLNNSGQAAFSARLDNTSGGYNNDDSGIFLGNVGSITQIARAGHSAPDGNGTFENFYALALNDSGQVAFNGLLRGISGGFAETQGIFRGSGGSVTQIARGGQSAPDNNGTFGFFNNPDLNNSGHTVFQGAIFDSIGGDDDDSGIFGSSGGGISQIAREDQPLPSYLAKFSQFFVPALNNSGQVAFRANLVPTHVHSTATQGIFQVSGGNINVIALDGQLAPDANGTFNSFDNPVLNNSNQLAFRAGLIGTSGGSSDNNGIFRGSGEIITQIARAGQLAPDANGTFSNFGSPALNDLGQAAFWANLTGTSGGSRDNIGIFRGGGGSVTQIARKGQSAPDANGTFLGFGDPVLNNSGQVAFDGYLDDTSGGLSDDGGIFTSDGIDFFQVIREGDSLGGGIIDVINGVSLNEHGQIAYQATLIGGNQVIGRWTPELHWRNPSSSTWDTTGRWTLGLKPAFVHDVFIDPAASLTVTGPATDTTVRSLQIGGGTGLATLSLQNGSNLSATNGVTIRSTGTLTGDGVVSGNIENQGTIVADNLTVVNGTISNHNTIRGSGRIDAGIINAAGGRIRALAGSEMWLSGEYLFVNEGLVEVNNSELKIDAYVNILPGTGLISLRNGSLIADAGIGNEGSIAATLGASTIQGDIANTGTIQVSGGAHVTFFGDVEQNGVLQIARVGTNLGTAVFLGEFTGSGGFTGGGDLFALGDLRPGNSPASVTFDGNLFLGVSSDVFLELGGQGLGEFDQMLVTGDLNLAGDLFISVDRWTHSGLQPAVFDRRCWRRFARPLQWIGGRRLGRHIWRA
ncbi:MAG: choice-of-anchor tandem repeat NxxGxxAF-containing protein [Pirellulaceae bacterium]